MARWQGKPKRKSTGGRLRRSRKKRKFEIGAEVVRSVVASEKRTQDRGRGGNMKTRIVGIEYANVLNPKTNVMKRVKVLSVQENPSDPHYVQRNIVTKGALVKTEQGDARVTSRPGQHGVVNAILV